MADSRLSSCLMRASPRADGDPAKAAESAGRDSTPIRVANGNETVLVVEDNEAMSEIAVRQLRELGYRVIETKNAAEALVIIESETSIDLLFSDVIMPGALDGIALAQKARKLRPGLKVLLTSGFIHRTTELSGSDGDITLPARILTKPYRKSHLAETIRQVLDE